MDDTTATTIMQCFGKAYFSRDRALLADVLCEDAEWHFAFGADTPDGRVRKGVDGFLRGIELVSVRDGRIAQKDVFWKQFRP